MSRYSKYIIGSLLGVVVVISAWQFIISAGDDKETEVSYPDNVIESVEIEASLNKDEFTSNEEAVLDIKLKSNKNSGSLIIEVEGMLSRFGNYYFEEKKNVSLKAGNEEKISISKKLPACSTCSGFPEDEYELDVKVKRGEYVLAEKSINFNLTP